MAGEAVAGRDPGPEIIELNSVPGFVVFDLPGAPVSAGGTRLAPDVTAAEVALLARAMTYKYAAFGVQLGGAKAGVRGDPGDAGRFLTGPDMGTAEEDFAPLRERRAAPGAMASAVSGVPFEDLLTGYGVAVAADTALRARWGWGWEGRSVAIEGFGKVGGGVAREVVRRGGRIAAVSTLAGCIADPLGLDIGLLLALRSAHGDRCVAHYGLPVTPPGHLFTDVDADVIVPGTRPGAITGQTARSLPRGVRVIAPAANAPYTGDGAEALRGRGILALPDFVCNAGAVLGYRSPGEATPEQVLGAAGTAIASVITSVMDHEDGPLAGALSQAQVFLRGWWGEPPAPPFAPETGPER